jgi:hypothetical protein
MGFRPRTARAGNRRFGLLSALAARAQHTKPPYKTDLLWELTLSALNHPGRARTHGRDIEEVDEDGLHRGPRFLLGRLALLLATATGHLVPNLVVQPRRRRLYTCTSRDRQIAFGSGRPN